MVLPMENWLGGIVCIKKYNNMEFIKFIFSSFWVFIGFIMILNCFLNILYRLINLLKK